MIRSLWFALQVIGRTIGGSARLLAAAATGATMGPDSAFERVPRQWVHALLGDAGIAVRVEGRDHVQGLGTCVYCANHVSLIDPGALLEAIPGRVRFVAKRSLFHVPVFGTALRLTGQIPVDRTDRESAKESLVEAGTILRDGVAAAIFVEGTRSRDGALQPFKKGAFVLAIGLQAPCVPVYIAGSRDLMPHGAFVIRPGTVTVRFGAPIPTTGLDYDDRDRLRDRCHEAIEALARA
jgi:1-acyl-sn-glycerol-3-phosphate acyltransferase